MRLCVCVDDVGLHPGIQDAALRLVHAGRVHALGCMVGAPAWAAAAAALRRLDAAEVDVGLHLDLTDCPLPPWPARALPALMLDAGLGRIDHAALRAAIGAQLDAFEAGLGRALAFVDGHQHVHQLPQVRDALVAELVDRQAQGARPWLRATRHVDAGLRPSLKARLIEALGARGLARLATAQGLPQNARLLGVYDFRGGAAVYQRLLLRWLRAARSGDLLMCHAGLGPTDALQAAREAEYEVWQAPATTAALRANAIVLEPMSRILARAPRLP